MAEDADWVAVGIDGRQTNFGGVRHTAATWSDTTAESPRSGDPRGAWTISDGRPDRPLRGLD